ncbi:MAG: WbuC family cupin fold metalloprotein [Candidatus Aminicenantales bacterium]
MESLEKIMENDYLYAIVIRKEFSEPGPSFFTPGEFSQQLGMLIHKQGKIVKRHRHKLIKREIFHTQEVLVLLKGKIQVDLYNDQGQSLKSLILKPGDAILLARGGHKVEVLEDAKILEVKQGPYAGDNDKEFF